MPVLKNANKVFLGPDLVKAVYQGSNRVWSRPIPLGLVTPGDTSGVLYWLATNGLVDAWTNPITSGAVEVQIVHQFSDVNFTPHRMTDRGASVYAYFSHFASAATMPFVTFDLQQKALKTNAYTIKGRNDASFNFLRSWVLEGSNDNGTWETLDERVNDTQQAQDVWGEYSAVSSKAYRYLRVRLTDVDSAGFLLLGIGEIEFYGEMQDATTPSIPTNTAELTYSSNGDTNGAFYWLGTNHLTEPWANPISTRKVTTFTSSQYDDVAYLPYRTTDRGASQYPWHSGPLTYNWIIYDFGGTPIQPNVYTMRGREEYNGLYSRNWVLEGSNDKSSWDTLDSRTNDTQQNLGTWGTYSASATEPYRFLRVRATGPDSGNDIYLVFSEIEFYGTIHY